jgi:hypothetical protein
VIVDAKLIALYPVSLEVDEVHDIHFSLLSQPLLIKAPVACT